jgi:hypothetical protein
MRTIGASPRRQALPSSPAMTIDREKLREHLVQTAHHVALGERLVARQKAHVAELLRDGHDTDVAMTMLIEFEEALADQIAYHDRLRNELNRLK